MTAAPSTAPFRLDAPINADVVGDGYHVIEGGEDDDCWSLSGFVPLGAARMMVAAPLMLAALENGREVVQDVHDDLINRYEARMGITREAVEESGRLLAEIDAAIAAARGEAVPDSPNQEPT